jgi:YVTN family beta-propeller protein
MTRAALLVTLALTLPTACDPAAPEPAPTASPTASATASSAGPDSPLPPVSGQPSRVTTKVTVGGQPCGVVAVAGTVWVTDAQRAQLVRIAGGKVVARTAVDETPCELAYGYGSLWVATQSGKLDRVDPKTGKVIARIAVGDTSYEPVVAFDAVWVTNRGSGTVSQIDPRNNRVVHTVATPFVNAGGIVAASNWLWIGNDSGGSKDLLRMDPHTRKLDTFQAGDRPTFVAYAGGSVWTADQGSATVTRLDPMTGRVLSTVPAGVRPVNLSAARLDDVHPEVWVPDDQGDLLIRIDATTGAVLERLRTGDGPAVVAPDGTGLWVTNFEDGSVWRIEPGARAAS